MTTTGIYNNNINFAAPFLSLSLPPWTLPTVIIVGVAVFFRYLGRHSRFWNGLKSFEVIEIVDGVRTITIMKNEHYPNTTYRDVTHLLVWSNCTYLFAAMYAQYVGEVYLSLFTLLTFFASSLYHLYGEQRFFNFDNIFASALMFIYAWSLVCAGLLYTDMIYFSISSSGLLVALYCIVSCGMPADINLMRDTLCACRCPSTIYPLRHSLWHILGGIGLGLTAHYFAFVAVTPSPTAILEGQAAVVEECWWTYHGDMILGTTCHLDSARILPAVPTLALVTSILINIVGNIHGIMPID